MKLMHEIERVRSAGTTVRAKAVRFAGEVGTRASTRVASLIADKKAKIAMQVAGVGVIAVTAASLTGCAGISHPAYQMPAQSPKDTYLLQPPGSCFTYSDVNTIGGGALANEFSPGVYGTAPSSGLWDPSGVPVAQQLARQLLTDMGGKACDAKASAATVVYLRYADVAAKELARVNNDAGAIPSDGAAQFPAALAAAKANPTASNVAAAEIAGFHDVITAQKYDKGTGETAPYGSVVAGLQSLEQMVPAGELQDELKAAEQATLVGSVMQGTAVDMYDNPSP